MGSEAAPPERNTALIDADLHDAGEDRVAPVTPALTQALRSESDRQLVAAALGLMLVAQIWLSGADIMGPFTDVARMRWRLVLRVAAMGVCAFGAWRVRRATTRSEYSRLVLWLSVFLVAVPVAINLLRPRGTQLPIGSPLLALIVLYGAMPNKFVYQLVPALTFSAAIIVERLWWLSAPFDRTTWRDIIVLVVVNAIGAVMTHRRVDLERALDFAEMAKALALRDAKAALAELRTLRGIIPICSFCKKVRLESGDWQRIEHYVQDHSDAEFSHGVCPDCHHQHYPQTAARAVT